MSTSEIQIVAASLLGWVLQWARAKKNVPQWMSYAGLVLAALALYVWMTPEFLAALQANWRSTVGGFIMFAMAGRGAASASRDTKLAPKTDSLK